MQTRVGSLYKYVPTLGDAYLVKGLSKENIVRVVSPASRGIRGRARMGNNVYVDSVDGTIHEMVFKGSLYHVGDSGSFIHKGVKYHYQKEGKEWTAWEDGKDSEETVATSFSNLFEFL
jgi:hypothetical protein